MEPVTSATPLSQSDFEDTYALATLPPELFDHIMTRVPRRFRGHVEQRVAAMRARIFQTSPACTLPTNRQEAHAVLTVVMKKPAKPEIFERALRMAAGRGFSVNERDHKKMTLLHHAAYCGKEPYISILLNGGAAINDQDDRGLAPLHYATWTDSADHLSCLKTLIARRADVDLPDNLGLRPLHYAVATSSNLVDTLLQGGVDPNLPDKQSRTPLHHAATIKDPKTAKACLKLLLEGGADLYAEDDQKKTVLMYSTPPEVQSYLREWLQV